jgi:hypothetical protein
VHRVGSLGIDKSAALLNNKMNAATTQPLLQQDKYGCTVCHQWARTGRADDLARAASTCLPALCVADRSGNTPLHVASTGEVVQAVAAVSVTPPLGTVVRGESSLLPSLLSARNAAGCTPLTCAVVAGRLGVVAALLRCVGQLGLQAPVLESRDATGRTALLHAAERGDLDVCELLLEAGAVATAEDDLGWCALHNAALGMYPEYESHLGVLRLLLGLPSPPSPAHPDRKGLTPLHVATDVRDAARCRRVGGGGGWGGVRCAGHRGT